MIKLVAFDLDGTIGNTIPLCLHAFKNTVERYIEREISVTEIVKLFGVTEIGMLQAVVGSEWKKAAEDFYKEYECLHYICPKPFDEIPELLREIKECGVYLALVTGKGERSCNITLRQFGLEKLFDNIETGAPDRNRKPDALKSLLDIYGLQPEEIVYIGDTVSDVMACREAGITCYSVAWNENAELEKLKEINQKNIVYSIKDLKKHLNL